MKRTGFKPRSTPLRRVKRSEGLAIEREPRALARLPVAPNYGPAAITAAPKSAPLRNRALLDMAQGRPCLLCPPGFCACPPGSVVACHSNLSIHGKAGARKADDCYSVWGGSFIHAWLDQGGATASVKERVFMQGLSRQIEAWKQVEADPAEPDRFRKAARWALEQIERRQA